MHFKQNIDGHACESGESTNLSTTGGRRVISLCFHFGAGCNAVGLHTGTGEEKLEELCFKFSHRSHHVALVTDAFDDCFLPWRTFLP
jgi:hypothetical protein